MWEISSDVRDDGLSSLVLLHSVQGLLGGEVGKHSIKLSLRHSDEIKQGRLVIQIVSFNL